MFIVNFWTNLYHAILIAMFLTCYFGQKSVSAQLPEPSKPKQEHEQLFELKGDKLGMSLADFKTKHERQIVDGRRTINIPRCANDRTDVEREKMPNEALSEEAWHAKAGINNVTLSVIFEDITENKFTPRLAGIQAYMHHYSFIDEKLFSIRYIMPRTGYLDIKEAMINTYGKITSESAGNHEDDLGNVYRIKVTEWKNKFSTINIIDKVLDAQYCAVIFTHDNLGKVVAERKMKFNKKKL